MSNPNETVEPARNTGAAIIDITETILLIEPDAEVRLGMRRELEKLGFEVLDARSGSEAIETAIRCRPKAVLLDMNVADPDGLTIIQRLREWTNMPILALSAKNDASEAVSVLDHGANDYISKPFRLEVLLARLRAAQRFAPPAPPQLFRSGSLTVDLTNRTVQVASYPVNLSATEYSLLRLFVQHAGKVLTHAHILSEVWGLEMRNQVNYLRVYLRFLRKKLENPCEPSLFITRRAVGYGIAIRH
jgi:two-component system KDP operon response regulator KdpE